MTEIIVSKRFSFKGWSIKTWMIKNKFEVIKVAGAVVAIAIVYSAGLPAWLSGLIGLVAKFGFDSLHYFLFSIPKE